MQVGRVLLRVPNMCMHLLGCDFMHVVTLLCTSLVSRPSHVFQRDVCKKNEESLVDLVM